MRRAEREKRVRWTVLANEPDGAQAFYRINLAINNLKNKTHQRLSKSIVKQYLITNHI